MSFVLDTQRLRLRPWADSDVDDYRVLVAERGNGMRTAEDIGERIAFQRAMSEQAGIALLAVGRRVEGDFIGYCGLIIGRAASIEEPEIAYELCQRVHGHGYATEAAHAVLDAAIATGRTRLWSTVRPWNAASLRVLDKLGFQLDHTSVDHRGELVVWLTRTLP